MTDHDALLVSLLSAVGSKPDDVPLRLHVASVLLDRGRAAEALEHCGIVLSLRPGDAEALRLLSRATATLSGEQASSGKPPAAESSAEAAQEPIPHRDQNGFDWQAAEKEVQDISPPLAFVSDSGETQIVVDSEDSTVRLSDVGGMEAVKQRLEVAFLGPMRNPDLARMFGKNLAGGLLLYGPPGCGKTFIARAIAGELGARFYSVSLADVLDQYLGSSEKNVKAIFDTVRRNVPCVLFLDEVDAIGQRRSRISSGWSGLRGAVNQLLTEMDSVQGSNDGVFILAATNHPWDIDPALRRPGRFDRTILVLPPDPPAREAILRYHMEERPLSGIDISVLIRQTDGFSGADLKHLCDSAAELALADSVRTGNARMIQMSDFLAALKQISPSIGPWLETARNVAMFANASGEYDELLKYLKSKRLA